MRIQASEELGRNRYFRHLLSPHVISAPRVTHSCRNGWERVQRRSDTLNLYAPSFQQLREVLDLEKAANVSGWNHEYDILQVFPDQCNLFFSGTA